MNIKRFGYIAVIAISVGVVLSGCATQKKRVATQKELEQTSREVIKSTIFFRTITNTCKTLGGETAQYADTVYDAWLARNWRWISAADSFYSDRLKARTIAYQNQEIALPALKLLADGKKKAETKIGLKRRTQSTRAKACKRNIAPYADPTADFIADPEKKLALETLLKRYGVADGKVHQIPSLAGSLQPLDAPGRTLYTVESSLHTQGCATPHLVTFKNDWPQEVYGAYCQNEKQFFIACEWGKCNTSRH